MVVYKTSNLINGLFYIGQDSNNNPNYLGSGLALNRAIKKYGKKNFRKEILEHCNTKEELNNREIYWIETLNAIAEGYNIAEGGSGGVTYKKGDETYYRIRHKLKNRTLSFPKGSKRPDQTGDSNPAKRPEVREKISAAKTGIARPDLIGDNNPAKRTEIRNKISKAVSESWKNRPIIKCPYCGKEGVNAANMKRWHFDNCKKNIILE